MKTYYLITTDPIAFSPAFSGFPATRKLPFPLPVSPPDPWDEDLLGPNPNPDPKPYDFGLPEGYTYIPDLDQPDYDPATQRIERAEPTLDGYGWRVIDLTPEEIEAQNPVPQSVTRRQLLLVLANLDTPILAESIEAMIGDNVNGLIEFRNAGSFERAHPLVGQLAAALGLSEDQVDEMFRQASTL
jgi:hypothetical protein